MKALAEWKIEALERVRAKTIDDLLDSTIHDAGGDDYDGCFTDRGHWEFEAEWYELRARLWIAGAIAWDSQVEDWKE